MQLPRKMLHPLPRIDDTLDALSGAQWFSTLDLASGYWQVEIDPADREKTAFGTSFGLHQFKVMPFGLCNAPSTFQRLMEITLAGLHWVSCLVYLDDIIIFGNSIQEHFQRLEGSPITVAAQGRTKVETKDVIKSWPIPANLEDLRKFLGIS